MYDKCKPLIFIYCARAIQYLLFNLETAVFRCFFKLAVLKKFVKQLLLRKSNLLRTTTRSCPQAFCKKRVLKNFAKFTKPVLESLF